MAVDATGPMYPHRIAALESALRCCNQPDSKAILWRYSVTHSQLALRIEGPAEVRAVLWLDACQRIESAARWSPVALSFRQVRGGPEYAFELADQAGAFKVRCGRILVGDDAGPFPETGV